MKILVLNCGSSSIKYALYNMDDKTVMTSGGAERVGLDGAFVKVKMPDGTKKQIMHDIPEHTEGVKFIFSLLTDPEIGVIKELSEIDAVGHRMVHGGEKFNKSVLLTDEVLKAFEECSDLAPLHNPANLKGVRAVQELMPGLPQVGVFDTAFHQTMPDYAYMYAIPYELYEKYGIRRYGFHGTSHRYVSQRVCDFLGVKAEEQRVITCHIGNGGSVAAVKHGKCMDTSMGLTPLEGVMMGTRSGDIDGGAVSFIEKKLGLDADGISNLLNKKSGVLGITGISSDMREIEAAEKAGNPRAILAQNMYNYRIKKYIGHGRGGHNSVHRRRWREPERHARRCLRGPGVDGSEARQGAEPQGTRRRGRNLRSRLEGQGSGNTHRRGADDSHRHDEPALSFIAMKQ